MTDTGVDVIPASRAFELAGITYRQLDYWARRGWVRPSVDVGLGRAGRRLYGPADVIRLGALGHLGASGLDVGRIGPALADVDLDAVLDEDFLIVASADGDVEVIPAGRLRPTATRAGLRVFFDPIGIRRQLGLGPAAGRAGRAVKSA